MAQTRLFPPSSPAEKQRYPHHVTSPAKLRKGFLQLDFGARYLNYCSDMSRILYLGKPSVSEKTF